MSDNLLCNLFVDYSARFFDIAPVGSAHLIWLAIDAAANVAPAQHLNDALHRHGSAAVAADITRRIFEILFLGRTYVDAEHFARSLLLGLQCRERRNVVALQDQLAP